MGQITVNSIGWFYDKNVLRKARVIAIKTINNECFCKLNCERDNWLIPYGSVYSKPFLAKKYE